MACLPCLSLKNGSFCIGVFYSVFALGVMSATLAYEDDITQDNYASQAFAKGAAIVSSLTFLSSLSLVYGIMEKRPEFVSPWLVMQLIAPIFTAVFYFWAIASSQSRNLYGPVASVVPAAGVIASIHITTMIGCLLVVHKYYTELKFSRDYATQGTGSYPVSVDSSYS